MIDFGASDHLPVVALRKYVHMETQHTKSDGNKFIKYKDEFKAALQRTPWDTVFTDVG